VKAAGHHQFKVGVDLEDNYLDDFTSLSGGRSYTMDVARDVPNGLQYVEEFSYAKVGQGTDKCYNGIDEDGDGIEESIPCTILTDFERSTNTLNWAAFVQDSWQIMPNLTVNVGLRYEEQYLRTGEQIRDYIDPLTGKTIGKNALVLDGLFAPRVGVLYDWTKEGRSKIYGNWGRFYESIPMDINNRAFGGETISENYYDVGNAFGDEDCGTYMPNLADNTQPRLPGLAKDCDGGNNGVPDLGGVTLGSGSDAIGLAPGLALIMPGLGPQYMDEIVFGVEYELFEDLRVGASYQNRSMGRVIEDLSVDGATTYIISNPGEEVDTSELEETREALAAVNPMDPKVAQLDERIRQFKEIKNFDKPRRDYNAFQLTANKRFSNNFFVQGSYTYSVLEGNYPGLFAADNGQLDPNITSQYDLVELLANRDGRLPADRPHNLKIDGYYSFDLKEAGTIIAGARLRAQSGVPIEYLGRHAVYGPNESFILPRGAAGRTEFVTQADLRLQYSRKLGNNLNLSLYFDLFNVFDTQTQASVDEEYTRDRVNPIVGGDEDDLPYLKAQTSRGVETGNPAAKKLNFGNTTSRLAPLSTRFGLRLEF
jgi:hypothetical protein